MRRNKGDVPVEVSGKLLSADEAGDKGPVCAAGAGDEALLEGGEGDGGAGAGAHGAVVGLDLGEDPGGVLGEAGGEALGDGEALGAAAEGGQRLALPRRAGW